MSNVMNTGILTRYTYGFLYNWYAVNTGKLAPAGWHVPSEVEYTTLINYLIANGYNYDDTTVNNKIAKSMCVPRLFGQNSVEGAPGNTDYPQKANITDLTILPSNFREIDGTWGYPTTVFSAFTSTGINTTSAYTILISYNTVTAITTGGNKKRGFSIRLLKDDSTLAPITIDGYTYKTVKIGSQVWLSENLKTTKYNDNSSIPIVTDNTAWSALSTGAYCIYNNESEPLTYTK